MQTSRLKSEATVARKNLGRNLPIWGKPFLLKAGGPPDAGLTQLVSPVCGKRGCRIPVLSRASGHLGNPAPHVRAVRS